MPWATCVAPPAARWPGAHLDHDDASITAGVYVAWRSIRQGEAKPPSTLTYATRLTLENFPVPIDICTEVNIIECMDKDRFDFMVKYWILMGLAMVMGWLLAPYIIPLLSR